MTKPLIGVTTFRDKSAYGTPQFSVTEAYVSALVDAGASALMVPLAMPAEALDEIINRLDGLLFSGGGDIHPETYGSQMHPKVSDVDRDRDRVELYLLNRALAKELPFLGVCRGLQLINVGLGGGLYEHISDQHEGAIHHQYYPDWPRDHLAHNVQIEAGSQLGQILGETELPVNSLHHQGVKTLAPGLRATAEAPDGILEGFELPEYPFGLAVQWHPEWLQAQPTARALFRAFVQACTPDP